MPTKENVLTRTDDFIKWFLPKIEKFPRNYEFDTPAWPTSIL